jgi:hypothetical protein
MPSATPRKPRQPDLPGHKATRLEIAARDLLLAKEGVEEAKKKEENAGSAMIEALRSDGRVQVMVEGYTFAVNTTPSREVLKVKKAEQR